MTTPPQQSDMLLWLAGAIVVAMGLTWLLIASPWSDGGVPASANLPPPALQRGVPIAPAAPQTSAPLTARDDVGASLEDNPLRMARLAHEAGMLVEPEGYSAWALYRLALQQDPDSPEARHGLETIAAELIRKADAAIEQGRFGDVRATIDRIRSAIPVHPGANDLAIRLAELAPVAPSPAITTVPPAEDVPPVEEEEEPAPQQAAAPPRPPDPAAALRAPNEAFQTALDNNQLLVPPEESAKHYYQVLTSLEPEHEITRQARSQLFRALVTRAESALEATDPEAAAGWIAEADSLTVDSTVTLALATRLRQQQIALESAKRVPASELTIEQYEAPEFPPRALDRRLSGWVDVEFTVALDGSTRDVVVVDASHNAFFRDEAIRAISAWRFQPNFYLGEPIERRSYTRIRFEYQ